MLANIDSTIFYFINKGFRHEIMDYVMIFLTEMGSGEFLFVVSLALLFSKDKRTKRFGLLLLAGLTLSFYSTYIIKTFVARPRPFMNLPDVSALVTEKSFSFPSGHATASFIAATILTGCFKKAYLFFGLAAVVCISRIYLGVHYPLDVLAGACLGTLIGWIVLRAEDSFTPHQKAQPRL